MRFRSERDVLAEVLGTAQRAVTSRNAALPVLAGLRLELSGDALRVVGTDLDLYLHTECRVAGQTDGVVVVPAKLTADIVRAFAPGAIEVEAANDEVRFSAGRSQYAVRTYASEDFPKVPVAADRAVTLPAAALADALRQVVPAASTDQGVPVVTGVLLHAEGAGSLRLVATDKYRLAMRELRGAAVLAEGQQVLVPARALAELQRLLGGAKALAGARGATDEGEGGVEVDDGVAAGPVGGEVTLRLGEHEATFEIGATRLTTRLIPGVFPDYRNLILSNYPNRLVVQKEPLLEALRRLRLLARDVITSVKVDLKADVITLTLATADLGMGTEDVDAKYEGADLTVRFNPAYLIDGLEAVGGDEVVLSVFDAVKQVILTSSEAPASDDYLYLLMPMRV